VSHRVLVLPALLAILIFTAFCGCDSEQQTQPVTVSEPVVDSAAQAPVPSDSPSIATPWIARNGQIIFESSVDSSTGDGLRLTLLQDGIARVDYFGTDSATSTGTYRIENHTRLQLDFGVDDPWLPMELSTVDGSLVVHAPDKEQIIQIAVEAGYRREDITEEDVQAAFHGWPLRQSTSGKPIENETPSTQ
jgi:hypothetical protein